MLDLDYWQRLVWHAGGGPSRHWAGFKGYVFHFNFPSRPWPESERSQDSDPDSDDNDNAYETKSDAFLEAASNACTGRKLFITRKGYLGLGPGALQEGDVVCVLFGGIVPFAVVFLDWSGVDLALNPPHPASILYNSKSSLELQCIYILNIERLSVNIYYKKSSKNRF